MAAISNPGDPLFGWYDIDRFLSEFVRWFDTLPDHEYVVIPWVTSDKKTRDHHVRIREMAARCGARVDTILLSAHPVDTDPLWDLYDHVVKIGYKTKGAANDWMSDDYRDIFWVVTS